MSYRSWIMSPNWSCLLASKNCFPRLPLRLRLPNTRHIFVKNRIHLRLCIKSKPIVAFMKDRLHACIPNKILPMASIFSIKYFPTNLNGYIGIGHPQRLFSGNIPEGIGKILTYIFPNDQPVMPSCPSVVWTISKNTLTNILNKSSSLSTRCSCIHQNGISFQKT